MNAALSSKEEALVLGIIREVAREPGLGIDELRVLIGKQPGTTKRVVERLVQVGVIERRRIHDREGRGLWLR